MHGYGISVGIEQMSKGVFRPNAGLLFLAIQGLQRDGLIDGERKATENNRRAKYYVLTRKGRERLYGVMAYSVAQRTNEIGIRLALGAQRQNVLRLVVGKGAVLPLIGVTARVAGAFGLTRFLSGMLYDVRPCDPKTIVAVAVLLALVAVLACYLPARRAMRVDPMVALSYE